jgi:hypothetical protein
LHILSITGYEKVLEKLRATSENWFMGVYNLVILTPEHNVRSISPRTAIAPFSKLPRYVKYWMMASLF